MALALFVALVAVNWTLIRGDQLPRGDLADDMLLMQRADHGWLLTGHYSKYGPNHPGPWFLSVRHLAGVLAAGVAGGPFGAQLFGTYALSAAFLGLFAGLLHRLGSRVGLGTAAAAATAAIAAVLAVHQLGGIDGFTGSTSRLRVAFANPWMPDALILPFAAFCAALFLLVEGSAVGLVAATFCGAVLVHGYATLPVVVGPLWLGAVVAGARARRAAGRGFFPASTVAAAAAIMAAFAAPLLADAALNPPGNLWRIVETASRGGTGGGPSPREVVGALAHQWLSLRPLPWIWLLAGLVAAVLVPAVRPPSARAAAVATAVAVLAFAAYLHSPGGIDEYQTRAVFGIVPALVAVAVVDVVAVVARRFRAAPLLLLGLTAAAALPATRFVTPWENRPYVRQLAEAVAAEVPRGGAVSIDGRSPGTLAALFLEFDRLGIRGCSRTTRFAHVLTRERICDPAALPPVAFRLVPILPCHPDQPHPSGRSIMVFGKEGPVCLILGRIVAGEPLPSLGIGAPPRAATATEAGSPLPDPPDGVPP